MTDMVSIIDGLPTQQLTDGSEALKVDTLQHPPGWTYLSLGFLVTIPDAQAVGQRIVSYHQVQDEAGNPMHFRAWTGKMLPQNCDVTDTVKIELVVKGSDAGGVDDTNDIVIDTFVRDLRPINGVVRQFTPPARSIFLPSDDASVLNPALPAGAGLFFKVVYVPGRVTVPDQYITFDLEGFEPPAGG